MPLLRDLWDMSIPGQRMNEARAMREQRALAAQQMEMEAAKAQAEQMQQQSSMQREAGLRAAKAVRAVAPRFGNDYAAAFDFVAGKSGGLFGSPEELSAIRGLVAEGGPEALDAIEAAFGAPQKPTNRFMAVGGKNIFDTQTEQFLTAPGGAAGSDDPLLGLKAQNIQSQIEDRRTRTSAAQDKAAREQEAAALKQQAKIDFSRSAAENTLAAVDKALSFFGDDADGDGVITDAERKKNVLDARGERGLGRVVGAARRDLEAVVPGSDIRRLKNQLKPLLSNVGLDRLVELKSSGATLGAVSNFELQTLQNTIGNLDQVDDPEQLFRDLQYIRNTLGKIGVELGSGAPAEGAAGSEDDAALLAKYGIQ